MVQKFKITITHLLLVDSDVEDLTALEVHEELWLVGGISQRKFSLDAAPEELQLLRHGYRQVVMHISQDLFTVMSFGRQQGDVLAFEARVFESTHSAKISYIMS